MNSLGQIRASRRGVRPRSWLAAMQVIGMVLAVLGVVSFANRAEAQEAFPLDSTPGLGRSPAAAQRDETIAAWEAFQREQVIASCMARAGFRYVVTAAFPEDALAHVARGLGVAVPASSNDLSPAQQNRAYEASLAAAEQERYARALYAESAADMGTMRRTGAFPAGRGADFGKGGCTGEANSLPSIWTLQRQLGGELNAMRQEIAASVASSAGDTYAACAERAGGITARGPADVERIAATDQSRSTAARVALKQCGPLWEAAYRSAEAAAQRSFAQRHESILRVAQERYRFAMKNIAADQGFRAYLEQNAAPLR